MFLTPEDLAKIRAEVTPRLIRVLYIQSVAIALLVIGLVILFYVTVTRRPELIAVSETGRIVPLVSLDQPYVSDSRVLSFADECVRESFGHDFLNFRSTLSTAKKCFTTDGGTSFDQAIAPLIKDLQERRMVMSATLFPAVVVQSSKRSGRVFTWIVQTKMTLYREGTKERVSPTTYVVDLVIERVPLEESVRGIAVSQINVRPGSA